MNYGKRQKKMKAVKKKEDYIKNKLQKTIIQVQEAELEIQPKMHWNENVTAI